MANSDTHSIGSTRLGRGVFLDRDGVINDVVVRDGKPYPPPTMEAMKILPGVPETLAELHRAGFCQIVVTNQPDVGAGKQRRDVVDELHRWLAATLPLDDIKVCFHVESDDCPCRKPRPGMLLAAASEWNLDLSRSYLVGDRWRDIEAGRAVGCQTFWIDRGYREPAPEGPTRVVSCLAEAGKIILSELSEEQIQP